MDRSGIRGSTDVARSPITDHGRDLMPTPLSIGSQTRVETLHCIECHRPWRDPAERWRLKVTDDSPPETVPYCARCATREFGPARRPPRAPHR
jgi:hypothetical protein